jgi:hypothetical protein
MENLNEVFDSDSSKNYPVTNLKPGSGVPQIFGIKAPGNDNLVARMVSYASQGDAIKQVKQGDKYVHVIIMSLSPKGTPAELKGGLGDDPFGALNTIFDTIYEQVNKLKMDAVLFRFPTKKMQGKGPLVQRVLARLAQARTGGKFKVVDAMYQFTGKHTYVLLTRRGTNIEDIKGMPEIDESLYTKVDSKVGEVYVSKKTGEKVTKVEAVAASIAKVEEKRTDKAVITRTKLKVRAAIASQYAVTPETIEVDPETSKVFAKFDEEVPLYQGDGKKSKEFESFEAAFKTFAKKTQSELAYINVSTSSGLSSQVSSLADALQEARGKLRGSRFPTDVIRLMAEEFKNLNPTNSFETMQKIVREITRDSRADIDVKVQALQRPMAIITQMMDDVFINAYEVAQSVEPAEELTKAEKQAIGEYCMNSFSDINLFLIGIPDEDTNFKWVEGEIEKLDSAFSKGVTLPKGTTVYRGQEGTSNALRKNIENRTFYFRNYVSTSLKPNIFSNVPGMASGNGMGITLDDESSVYTDGHAFSDDWNSQDANQTVTNALKTKENAKIDISFVIKGVEKIKVVVPGSLSEYAEEAEVILPRGTTLRVNKTTTASLSKSYNRFLLECDVMDFDRVVAESEVVYDGDLFLETGEVKPVKGSKFAEFLTEAEETSSNEVDEILCAFTNISALPEKFRM